MIFTSLGSFVEIAAKKGKKRIVVAAAQDEDVLRAVKSAMQAGFIVPILIGDQHAIRNAAKSLHSISLALRSFTNPTNSSPVQKAFSW